MSGGKLTRATQEAAWVRYTLLTVGLGFLFFFLGLPLIAVFVEALAQGLPAYLEALKEPETRSAIWLTVASSGPVATKPPPLISKFARGMSARARPFSSVGSTVSSK